MCEFETNLNICAICLGQLWLKNKSTHAIHVMKNTERSNFPPPPFFFLFQQDLFCSNRKAFNFFFYYYLGKKSPLVSIPLQLSCSVCLCTCMPSDATQLVVCLCPSALQPGASHLTVSEDVEWESFIVRGWAISDMFPQ